MRDGALNANMMGMRFGGKQARLQKTILKDVGTYNEILQIGDEQSMIFKDHDNGPFYLNPEEQLRRKYNQFKDRVKIINNTKRQLLEELKEKGFLVRKYFPKEEIHELANNHQISLTYEQQEVLEGWVGKPKGILHVLWESGWINEAEIEKYSADGKSSQKDEFKN